LGFACITTAATPPPVIVASPCECRDDHGKGRWSVKNDPSTPPVDVRAIHAITPSDVFGWPAWIYHWDGNRFSKKLVDQMVLG
jgi:hypothetical protein